MIAFEICFDFNNMKTIEKDKLIKCKRICRLDSPFLERLYLENMVIMHLYFGDNAETSII